MMEVYDVWGRVIFCRVQPEDGEIQKMEKLQSPWKRLWREGV